MANVKILDCTLRDGGYINNWMFGEKTIKKILEELSDANIDIIECGFLSDIIYNREQTLYNNVSQIKRLLPQNSQSHYVAMLALGEKEISYQKISEFDNESISGIRLTFHKHEIDKAKEYAGKLMEKGYQVYFQPVGTCAYSDKELLDLFDVVNEIQPYAFYIVDTFGTLTSTELLRIFCLVDNNLKKDIKIGFHSHNNLQLSFANAQELIRLFTNRGLIIDSSVLGMGRGAGNLCTELLAQYMNVHLKTYYDVTNLLEIVDSYLMRIKEKYPWGYSIPYYIAAIHKCHPNYATYLMNRQTVTVNDIEHIIRRIPESKRAIYDMDCIAQLYNTYQSHYVDDTEVTRELEKIFAKKSILVIAPGASLLEEYKKIENYINANAPYIIAVNFVSGLFKEDMFFISNIKRFEELDFAREKDVLNKVIVTSNIDIQTHQKIYKINYSSYLNEDYIVSDNSCLMLLKLLKKCGVTKVALAGVDGFVSNVEENYYDKELVNNVESECLELKTLHIKEQIRILERNMEIVFITKSQYEGD